MKSSFNRKFSESGNQAYQLYQNKHKLKVVKFDNHKFLSQSQLQRDIQISNDKILELNLNQQQSNDLKTSLSLKRKQNQLIQQRKLVSENKIFSTKDLSSFQSNIILNRHIKNKSLKIFPIERETNSYYELRHNRYLSQSSLNLNLNSQKLDEKQIQKQLIDEAFASKNNLELLQKKREQISLQQKNKKLQIAQDKTNSNDLSVLSRHFLLKEVDDIINESDLFKLSKSKLDLQSQLFNHSLKGHSQSFYDDYNSKNILKQNVSFAINNINQSTNMHKSIFTTNQSPICNSKNYQNLNDESLLFTERSAENTKEDTAERRVTSMLKTSNIDRNNNLIDQDSEQYKSTHLKNKNQQLEASNSYTNNLISDTNQINSFGSIDLSRNQEMISKILKSPFIDSSALSKKWQQKKSDLLSEKVSFNNELKEKKNNFEKNLNFDLKNRKVMSIKNFNKNIILSDQDNQIQILPEIKTYHQKKLTMHEFLKRDSKERLLGSNSNEKYLKPIIGHSNFGFLRRDFPINSQSKLNIIERQASNFSLLNQKQLKTYLSSSSSFKNLQKISQDNLSQLGQSSKAKAKFEILSAIKSLKQQDEIDCQKLVKYNRQASFYQLNNSGNSGKMKNIIGLSKEILDQRINNSHLKYLKPLKIEDKHPLLMKELNNPHSPVPAYVRFQKQNDEQCLLRDDLKEIKEKHFRKNYEKQLQLPKQHMHQIKKGSQMDANKYYSMKYFLTQDQRQDIYKTNNELN